MVKKGFKGQSIFDVLQLQFGSMLSKDEFLVEWDCKERSKLFFNSFTFTLPFPFAKVLFDFQQSCIIVFFFEELKLFKAQIKFTHIDRHILIENEELPILTISFTRNPLLWMFKGKLRQKDFNNPHKAKSWIRVTQIASEDQATPQVPSSQLMNPPDQDFTNWSMWRLIMSDQHKENSLHLFQLAVNALTSYKLVRKLTTRGIYPIAHSQLQVEPPRNMTFTRLYLIECLVSHNLINRYQLTDGVYDLIQKPSRQILERAVERLWVKNRFINNPIATLQDEFEIPSLLIKPKLDPVSHASVRKVIITPTRLYFLPPIIEESNRVLRQFPEHQDRFIRVSFCDEEFNPISASFHMNHKLLKRVQDVMHFGFQVARRHYKFLAFSSSQLREHNCWFFSDGKGQTGNTIRSWMGDFSDIKIAAKYAARMGQCFSSSRDGAKIGRNGYGMAEDIEAGENLFTDGVGVISSSKMEEIAKQLELTVVPSAIQFRMGGFKGVLASWPILSDIPIYLRDSQQKFKSKHTILEVIRVATFNAGHLNRQIIILLSTLGVPDSTFLELQNEMLAKINSIKTDPMAAIPVLTQLSDEFGSCQELIKLIKAGFFHSRDKFLKNCLNIYTANANNLLKNRARIQVPKGALLMGVADETFTLAPNEIFVQYSDPSQLGKTVRVEGTCIVTRNPCFHPGDIRVVTAVNVPRLHHLVDCVVFSVRGEQSIPSMCSGGDLDGDDFTVIWDERLIPPRRNLPPMKHLPAQPEQLKEVTISHVQKFFGDYIMNDNLGQIANAHLALSDSFPDGAENPLCLVLAQLHSRAVDFTKTGIRAEFNKLLRPTKFPDFMGKEHSRTYKSTKILGQLFRSLNYVQVRSTSASKLEPSLRVPGYEEFLNEAYILKAQYDNTLQSLMDQYGIENELEIVTGCILKYREVVCKRRIEVRRIIAQAYHAIRTEFLHQFHYEFKDSTLRKSTLSKLIRRKAYAWYYAAYTPTRIKSETALESFAWIAKDYLIPIKLKAKFGSLDRIPISDPAYELANHLASQAQHPRSSDSVSVHDFGDFFANYDSS